MYTKIKQNRGGTCVCTIYLYRANSLYICKSGFTKQKFSVGGTVPLALAKSTFLPGTQVHTCNLYIQYRHVVFKKQKNLLYYYLLIYCVLLEFSSSTHSRRHFMRRRGELRLMLFLFWWYFTSLLCCTAMCCTGMAWDVSSLLHPQTCKPY